MTIKIMNAVWESGPTDHTSLLVLLAMSDIADEDGRLWPSVARIAEKARMSERNARRIIRLLEADGWLETTVNRGRNNTSSYRVNTDKITGQNNRTNCPPGQNAPENRTNRAIKPDIAVSPEPSVTIKEPSKKSAQDAQDILAALAEVVSEETAEAFIAHRKAKRAKLTVHAAELIAGKIRGHPAPDAVVLESIANGWTGVFPEKVQAPAPRFTPQFDPAKFEGIQ